MVKRLNVPLSEEDYNEISKVKNNLDLTWEEFLIEAAKCLDEAQSSRSE